MRRFSVSRPLSSLWTSRSQEGFVFIRAKTATHLYQPMKSASGLVVKSIVAIDGPRVRFAAGATSCFLQVSSFSIERNLLLSRPFSSFFPSFGSHLDYHAFISVSPYLGSSVGIAGVRTICTSWTLTRIEGMSVLFTR